MAGMMEGEALQLERSNYTISTKSKRNRSRARSYGLDKHVVPAVPFMAREQCR